MRRGTSEVVSIPSSSGPGFGRSCGGTDLSHQRGFNPLFIGAWVRTILAQGRQLSATCFNPLFIGAWVRTMIPSVRNVIGTSFNPLFIGAWVRTMGTWRTTLSLDGFNPLFIGAWVRTTEVLKPPFEEMLRFNPLFIGAWVGTNIYLVIQRGLPSEFQSPLHRGLGSDEGGGKWIRRKGNSFQSPLHRGLGSDVCNRRGVNSPKFVSIPSSSGPGFGRKLERSLTRVAASSFNPLFIGAWVRTKDFRFQLSNRR